MVHKKYIRVNGKRYGPYLYESYREDGKVKKRYIGQDFSSGDRNFFKNNSFTLLFLIILAAFLFAGYIAYSNITGKSISTEGSGDLSSLPQSDSQNEIPATPDSAGQNSGAGTDSNEGQVSNDAGDSGGSGSPAEPSPSSHFDIVPDAGLSSANSSSNETLIQVDENSSNQTIIPGNTSSNETEFNVTLPSNTGINITLPSNESVTNGTLNNQTNQTIAIPENETLSNETLFNSTSSLNLSVLKNIPTLRIGKNSSADINLSEYFSGAESYSLNTTNISALFSGSIMKLIPDSDFYGARQAKVTAYLGSESLESNQFNIFVSSGNIGITTARSQIKVGESVKWTKNISLELAENVTIELPKEAHNISVKKVEEDKTSDAGSDSYDSPLTGGVISAENKGNGLFSFVKKLFSLISRGFGKITGSAIADSNETNASISDNVTNTSAEDNSIQVVLSGNSTNYVIEYETPAPQAFEYETLSGKKVVVSGPDGLNYTDVLSFANITEKYSVGQESRIKIFWVENKSLVPFDAFDIDENGKIDYVEWTTPHLSNQTFEIILITKAEHLDSNRTFIEDVYEYVKNKDSNWTLISNGDYLRVTFERNLTNKRDITIYARNVSGNSSIEVYEDGGSRLIASFDGITNESYYKVFLTNLSGDDNYSQDVFDLHVIGGDVEFDYVVDPVDILTLLEICGPISNGQTIYCLDRKLQRENDIVVSSPKKYDAEWFPDGHPLNGFKNLTIELQMVDLVTAKNLSIRGSSLVPKNYSGHFDFNTSVSNNFADFDIINPNFTWFYSTNFVYIPVIENSTTNYSIREYQNFSPLSDMNQFKADNLRADVFLDPDVSACGTLGTANSTYTLTQNVETDGTCFTVTANNVTLNGSGYVITYSNLGTFGYGVVVTGFNLTRVQDAIILEGTDTTDDKYGILYNTTYNSSIQNTTIITTGVNAHAINLWKAVNNTVIGNNISTSGNAAHGIRLFIASNNTIDSNLVNISGTNTLPTGILLSGAVGSNFHSNKVINNNISLIGANEAGINLQGGIANNITGNNVKGLSGGTILLSLGLNVLLTRDNVFENNVLNYTGTQGGSTAAIGFGSSGSVVTHNNSFSHMQIISSTRGIYLSQVTSSNNFTMKDSYINSTQGGDVNISKDAYAFEINFTNVTNQITGNPVNIFWDVWANGTLYVHWYLMPQTVINQTGGILSGVNITAWNNRSEFQFSEISGSKGNISKRAVLEYMQVNDSLGGSMKNYSSYTLNASKIGYLNFTNSTIVLNTSTFVNVSLADNSFPSISFVSPTTANGTTQSADSIYLNVTSNDTNDHYTAVDFDRRLLGWWRMDDVNVSNSSVIADISSYSNNISARGGAVLNTSGIYGKSYSFDGINDFISVGDNATLRFTNNTNFTISGWINKRSNDVTAQAIFDKRASGGYSLFIDSSGRVAFAIQNASGANDTLTSTSPSLQNNTWIQVAAVFFQGNVTLYVNGTAVFNGMHAIALSNGTTSASMGQSSASGTFLNGSVDEILVFNRTLSAQEIGALYNATASQYFNNFTGLTRRVSAYNFTAYAVDAAGNKNQTEQRTVVIPATTSLSIFDLEDDSEDRSAWFSSEQILPGVANNTYFFANYTINADNSPILNSQCNVSYNGGNEVGASVVYNMSYNSSAGIYFYNRTFTYAGNYSWAVQCSALSNYDPHNASSNVSIAIPLRNATSLGIVTNLLTLNYNETINLTLIIPNSGINNASTGYNISSVWANITMPNGTVTKILLGGSVTGGTWNATYTNQALLGVYNVTYYANLTNGFNIVENVSTNFAVKNTTIWISVAPNVTNTTDVVTVSGLIRLNNGSGFENLANNTFIIKINNTLVSTVNLNQTNFTGGNATNLSIGINNASLLLNYSGTLFNYTDNFSVEKYKNDSYSYNNTGYSSQGRIFELDNMQAGLVIGNVTYRYTSPTVFYNASVFVTTATTGNSGQGNTSIWYSLNNVTWRTLASTTSSSGGVKIGGAVPVNNSREFYILLLSDTTGDKENPISLYEINRTSYAYPSTGDFVSAAIFLPNVSYTTLRWNQIASSYGSVSVRLRESNDNSTWSAWSGNFTSGEIDNEITSFSRAYIQYQAFLNSTNESSSPVLLTVNISYFNASTNTTGGYTYNVTIPTTTLGVLPLDVAVVQSPQGIVGTNRTNITIWARTAVPYVIIKNYTGGPSNYSVYVNFTRTDTNALIPGTINVTISNSSSNFSGTCVGKTNCSPSWIIPGDVENGNFSVSIKAFNESGFYLNASSNFSDYLERRNTTGSLLVPNKSINDFIALQDYSFYWNATVNNTGRSIMYNVTVYDVVNARGANIKVVNQTNSCSPIYPGAVCNMTMLITLYGTSSINVPDPDGFISFRANWTDNDGGVAGGASFIAYPFMYVTIVGNATLTLSNETMNITVQHGNKGSLLFYANSTGSSAISNVNLTFSPNASNSIQSSWINITPNYNATIPAGSWQPITLNFTVPLYTIPRTYVGVINITSNAGGGAKYLNISLIVPINGSWYFVPGTNLSYNNSFGLSVAGEIGNYTLVDTGNVDLNMSISYSAWGQTLWSDFGSSLFQSDFAVGNITTNPSRAYIGAGNNTTITLYQKGRSVALNNVGVGVLFSNETATPNPNTTSLVFNIEDRAPSIRDILFLVDGVYTNITELNKNVTIKIVATDDLNLNRTATTINVTTSAGTLTVINATNNSEFTISGSNYLGVNYTGNYTPTNLGLHNVTAKVEDSIGHVNVSRVFNFTVQGTTTVNLIQNISSVNTTAVDLTNKHIFYVNYTINNTGSVYAYSPNLTFQKNSTIIIGPSSYLFSDIPPNSSSSQVLQMNVSQLTGPGTYNISSTLTYRNPDYTNTSSGLVLTLIVGINKSVSTNPSSLSYTLYSGSSNTTPLIVNNTGNYQLTSVNLSCFTGSVCSGFTIDYSSNDFDLLSNRTRQVNITLTAALSLPAGSYSGSINVSEQNVSRNISVFATVPQNLSWSVDIRSLNVSRAISSSGVLQEITVSNGGNVDLNLSIAVTNSTLIQTNVSEIFIPLVGSAKFMINYSATSYEGSAVSIVKLTNTSANPTQINVTINLTSTALNVTVIYPNSTAKITGVLNAQNLSVTTNSSFQGVFVSTNSSWNVSIGGSQCTNLTATVNVGGAFWNISCNAPNIADGLTYDLIATLTHDVYGVVETTASSVITYLDLTPPRFVNISRRNSPLGGFANLSANITDNVNVSAVTVQLTYPNGTVAYYNLSFSNDLYNLSSIRLNQSGEYSANYTANDSTGNLNSTTDWFEVEDKYNWSNTFYDYIPVAVSGLNVSLARPNTTTFLLANVSNSNGALGLIVNRRFYDLHAKISSDEVIVRNVNFTNASSFYFNLHRISSGDLGETIALHKPFQGIASNSTNLSSNPVNAIFNYTGLNYDNSNALEVVKCASWNYSDRACGGGWASIDSFRDVNLKIVQGNSSGFSSYFLAESTCGNGVCEANYDETLSSCASDCVIIPTSGGSSSGGGGGGGGGLSSIDLTRIEDLIRNNVNIGGVKLETTSVYKELFPGDSTSFRIKLSNTLNSASSISMRAEGDISKFVTFESTQFSLGSGETRDVLIRVFIPKFTEPMNYDGDLIISSGGKEGKIPVTIKVLSPEGKLLDVKIVPLATKVAPGGKLRIQTDILNLGKSNKVDVQFDLQLLDLETGQLYARSEEAFAVETSISTVKNFTIPETVLPGKYLLKATAYYASLEDKSQQASSIAYITVGYPFWQQRYFGIPFWVYFIILGGIGLVAGSYYYARYLEFKKRRFKVKIEFNKLPQPGPNTAFVGKIAETGIRAFTDLNKLQMHTLIAGSTGSGKTIAAQDIVEAALIHNKSVIVFDPTAQWTGFLRKCEDKGMLNRYSFFDMKTKEARAFNGSIKTIHDPYEVIEIKRYMNKPGEITIFNVSHLTPAQIDILVASTIEQIFRSEPEESPELKNLIVYDEVHRLLPKFGGTGQGFIQLERGAREFRKWGIGLLLISQVLSDFIGEIKANIGTEVQMGTRYEGDLERIGLKYSEDILKSVVKEPIGTGMNVNAEFNSGRPYFISFRPVLHSVRRLSNEDLKKYEDYFVELDDLEYQVEVLKKSEVDVLDAELELKLAKQKVKEGQFQMSDVYLESLKPVIEGYWKKLGKKPVHREVQKLNKEEIKKGITLAEKERANYLKKNPEKEISFEQLIEEASKSLQAKKRESKNTADLEERLNGYKKKLNSLKGKLTPKDKEDVMKEIQDLKKEAEAL